MSVAGPASAGDAAGWRSAAASTPAPPSPDANWECFSDRLCDALRWVLPSLPVVRLGKGEVVYNLGGVDNRLYLIEQGYIKISTTTLCGRECLLGLHGPLELIGESCLLGRERMDSAIAMGPATVRHISRQPLVQLLIDLGLFEDFLGYLAARLVEQQQVIAHFVTHDSEHRLAATLLRLGRRLGRSREARALLIEPRITCEELAQMVGTTRSRVGYFLNRFRCRGLIEMEGDSLRITDEEGLLSFVAL